MSTLGESGPSIFGTNNTLEGRLSRLNAYDIGIGMSSSFTEARKRQLARLGVAKPPTVRAAMALAKSQAYQDAADAPATLRASHPTRPQTRNWRDH